MCYRGQAQSVMKKEIENSVQLVQWKPLALTRTAIPVAGEEQQPPLDGGHK